MRINREILMKLARDTVTRRVRSDRSVIAAYLCGSLLEDEFLLGGATDIDLVLIHADTPEQDREIISLTDDVHVDLAHHFHRDYRQARSLRLHPWLGPVVNSCQILYDPQHLLNFTQASVRGGISHAEYVLNRARKGAEHAREMWQGFRLERPEPTPREVSRYLRAVEHAANAVAGLSGAPITERRFLMKFPERAEAVGRPAMHAALLGLLGAPQVDSDTVQSFLPGWQEAYTSQAGAEMPARLHPVRLPYYSRGIQALLEGPQPMAALWPLERTWALAAERLPENSRLLADWNTAFARLGLVGEGFEAKIAALDAYLDEVEEVLEAWGRANGAISE